MFTVTATVTDTQGIVGRRPHVVNVTEQSSIPVTLTRDAEPGIGEQRRPSRGSSLPGAGRRRCGVRARTISSYSWDFGDGGGTQTTGVSTNHRYTAPGTYSASVTVRSTTGQQGFATLTMRVNP